MIGIEGTSKTQKKRRAHEIDSDRVRETEREKAKEREAGRQNECEEGHSHREKGFVTLCVFGMRHKQKETQLGDGQQRLTVRESEGTQR